MTNQCPNCSTDFIEQNDTCYRCPDCGWLRFVDDKWVSVPEPVRITEPDPAEPPKPPEPDPLKDPNRIITELVPGMPVVKQYFGGLVTVEVEDDEDEEND